ncbi:virulence-associated protein E [Streptococcus satellite phage Javan175]|uniref:DNA primase family protein n=1 Tax=Streptococcus entericus TaxID=155680 RepID=UPI00037E1D07|nr:phage/plasmid primase, P4 family [Streptococcus entericus]QBX07747.1 virulence-associated protein E [Streptococcus satellite phage Javan175]
MTSVAKQILAKELEKPLEQVRDRPELQEVSTKLATLKGWQSVVSNYADTKRQELLESLLTKGEDKRKAEEQAEKPLAPTLVARIMAELLTVCRIESDEGEKPVYFYDPDQGVYRNDKEFLKDFINAIEYRHNERRANDCIYFLTRKAPYRRLEEDPALIIVGNGIYNRKTKALMPYTPNRVFTSKIATNYNPRARSPNINGWRFDSWLLDLFDGNQELYQLALQLLNAVVRGESLGKMFWFVGAGGTGKGTLQELFINLVGRQNIASIKITDLDINNRFTLAQAIGKQAIIGDDVQAGAVIKDTSKLFSLVGGDTISVEKKGKDAYSTFIKTVVIQSTNEMPKVKGDYQAIRRRMVILPFSKRFEGKPNRAIKTDYIKRAEVLEYVLNQVIDLDYKEFISPKVSQDMLDDYQKELDPVLVFAQELFDNPQSSFFPNDFIWWCFVQFANYHNHQHQFTSQGLNTVFPRYLPQDWEKAPYPVSLPAGADLPKGFYPHDDMPNYLPKTYNPARTKNQRGYRRKR